jgi:hypothetical protein
MIIVAFKAATGLVVAGLLLQMMLRYPVLIYVEGCGINIAWPFYGYPVARLPVRLPICRLPGVHPRREALPSSPPTTADVRLAPHHTHSVFISFCFCLSFCVTISRPPGQRVLQLTGSTVLLETVASSRVCSSDLPSWNLC